MFVKPLIGNVNQLVIKTPLCNAALIPRYRNDCSALWIERKSDSPNAAICIEAELLHVGVARALQGIDIWPPENWPSFANVLHKSDQLFLNWPR